MREASLCWEILELLPANPWTEEHKKGQGRWRNANGNGELFLTIEAAGTLSCLGPRCVCARSGGAVGLYSGASSAVGCFQGDPGFPQHLLEFIFPYRSVTE